MNKLVKPIRLIVALLCLIVGNSMHAYTYNYDFGVDGLYYKIRSDGESVDLAYEWARYSYGLFEHSYYTGDIVVPESVTYGGKQYAVTGFYSDVFKESPALTSVVLPNTITMLPSFYKCTALTEVKFANSITSITSSTFSGCSALSKIEIPESVTNIDNYAFSGCSSLGSIVIPNSVTNIGDEVFSGCTSLRSIVIPESVDTLGRYCFKGCSALSSVTIEDGTKMLTVLGHNNVYRKIFYDSPLTSVYLGRNITEEVFSEYDCSVVSLKTLTIGPSVTKIATKQFYGCSNLTTVNILGKKPIEICDYAFSDCTKLSTFQGEALNHIETIGMYAFSGCAGITELFLPSIKQLGEHAFDIYNGKLEAVYLGNDINIVPKYCFYQSDGKSLKRVYLGTGVTTLQEYAFYSKSLTDLYLFSNDLVTLGTNALPTTLSKIYVIDPSRYDNLLKDYYRDYLITLNPCTAEYSGSAPTFSFVNNVANTDVSIVPGSINVNVGEYNTPISLEFSNGSWSSTISVKASYTITRAQLTIIANDATKVYGTPNPPLTCSYFGFKNGESTDVLTTLPSIETTATTGSDVGTYPIIPVGAVAQNYTFNYERGTLTITKADQTITWNQQFGTVNVGDVVELTATSSAGLPIKYTSTDESVAEIYSQNGRKYVEFLKSGNVMLRANQEGNENYNEADRVSKSVSVAFLVTDITLNNSNLTLEEGKTAQLVASVQPEEAQNKTIQWSSSNTSVATVDNNGFVTAIKQGTAVIYAKSTDGSNVTAQCAIKVIKLVEGISLNLTSASINEGQTIQLQATIVPDYADNQTIKWSSDNATVASVDQSGNVTALSKGEATITAQTTDGSNLSATCRITVIKLVSSIVLSKSQLSIEKGESTTLTAKVTPTDATNTALQWSSMNEAIATVDNGVVTAVSCGKTKIIVEATDGSGVYAECEVEVTDGAGINDASYYEAAVSVSNSSICIKNAPNSTVVRIIQSDGREVFRHISTGEQITYQPNATGIYLVVVGTKSYKIALN